MISCPKHQDCDCKFSWHMRTDQVPVIRVECAECGKFLQWAPRTEQYMTYADRRVGHKDEKTSMAKLKANESWTCFLCFEKVQGPVARAEHIKQAHPDLKPGWGNANRKGNPAWGHRQSKRED